MKSILYIISGLLVVVIGIGIFAFNQISWNDSATDEVFTDLPPAPEVPAGSSSSMELETETGIISVRDFLTDPNTYPDTDQPGKYELAYTVDKTVDTPVQAPYLIAYDANTDYFNIALFQEPLGKVRKDAEQYLMQTLDLSQSELCQLKYMVSVPNRVDPELAGVSLGFSSCPGSIPLE